MKKNLIQLIKEAKFMFIINYLVFGFFVILDLFTNVYLVPLTLLFGVNSVLVCVILVLYRVKHMMSNE